MADIDVFPHGRMGVTVTAFHPFFKRQEERKIGGPYDFLPLFGQNDDKYPLSMKVCDRCKSQSRQGLDG